MNRITRRSLLKKSGSAAVIAGLGAGIGSPQASAEQEPQDGPKDVRLAIIGTGGRGGGHIKLFSNCTGVKLVAFCDVDQNHVNNKADEFEKTSGTKIARFTDYRELLKCDNIDAVTIATPNHWHSLMAIHAMQAGKHVYVEKPVCHTLWEGRQMVEAEKKYDVVCAAGFQNRSVKGVIKAMSIIHSGKFGAIKQIRGLCYRNRKGIGKSEQPITPPESVNYDLWLGPAADMPIKRPSLHYDWHWDFNTGNGDMGNQGPHEMDLVQYALGDLMRHPNTVQSFGGRFAWDDGGNTPNMQCAMFDYGIGIPVIFEVRNLYQKGKDEKSIGAFGDQSKPNIIVTMEKGEYRGGRSGGVITDNDGNVVHQFKGGDDHYQNFINAVANNDSASIRSTLQSAFYSSCMSHLANISLLAGSAASDEQVAEAISGEPLSTECFERFCKQLDLWKVDRTKTPWQLGSKLTFDSETEQFTAGENLSTANELLRRKDREPYVVPEFVNLKSG